MSTANLEELVLFYKSASSLDLLYDIAIKKIDLKELKAFKVQGDRIFVPKSVKPVDIKPEVTPSPKPSKKQEGELIIFGESSDKIQYTLANCCKPIPGDDVFGFLTTGEGLKIHRTNCPNATRLLANYGHRVVKTKWAKNKEISFLTGLQIIGLDDVGVIHKITNLISGELKVNIAAMTIEAHEGIFEGNVRVFVQDKEHLDNLVNKLLELPGIEKVTRYDTE
jgi:GTP pyrophosphokinase